jgi:hypothetical protein
MTSSKTYTLPTDLSALANRIALVGGPQIDVKALTGSASGDGVKLSWSIAHNSVTITVNEKLFFVSYSTIWSHADFIFNS